MRLSQRKCGLFPAIGLILFVVPQSFTIGQTLTYRGQVGGFFGYCICTDYYLQLQLPDSGILFTSVIPGANAGDYVEVTGSLQQCTGVECTQNRTILQVSGVKFLVNSQFHIGSGWNLVSVPVDLRYHYYRDIFGPKAFMAPTFYTGGYPNAYVINDSLQAGRGYWIRFSDSLTVSLYGFPLVAETVGVVAGWNMLGSITTPVPVSSVTSDSAGLSTSNYFGYSAEGHGYTVVDTIKPGSGYWVRANRTGNIIFSQSSASGRGKYAVQIMLSGEMPPSPPDDQVTSEKHPTEYRLEQCYPNPFNPMTNIGYSIPKESDISLIVYDVLGREVTRLIQEHKERGEYSVSWNAAGVPSGVYYYRLVAGTFVETKKMIVMK